MGSEQGKWVKVMPRVEKPFYHPDKKRFEAFPPLDADGIPFEAELPEHLKDVCRHSWKIKTPEGATSEGRCEHCRAKRDFSNSPQDHIWEDTILVHAWRGVKPAANESSGGDDGY